ncbi:MAG: VRR-NUC domain-containing protein [Thermoanaerobaculia bacterium]
MKFRATTIYCSAELSLQWPRPLARSWMRQYPHLFDRDDLRLVLNQPRYHFPEWFTAIHLFQRDGVQVLLEKYAYGNHDRKRRLLRKILSREQLAVLDEMRNSHQVQPPDLFVFAPDGRFWFAEAKGPQDRLRPKQLRSHEFIRKRLRVPVEVFQIRVHKVSAT